MRRIVASITDNGEAWLVEIDHDGVTPADDDICAMLHQLAAVIDDAHRRAHIAMDLAERRN